MSDYSICYRRTVGLAQLPNERWETFVSAFNGSERVREVFSNVSATTKHWLIHKEYGLSNADLPNARSVFHTEANDESAFIADFLQYTGSTILRDGLCIDITGLMRPHLMLLVKVLFDFNINVFDVLYSDPVQYKNSENTSFSMGSVTEVRQVIGFEGNHDQTTRSKDLLVIGTGFDHELVRSVASNKQNARKRLMFGLPSLQPDMYQQGRLWGAEIDSSLGDSLNHDIMYSPANNPFATAQTLSKEIFVERARAIEPVNVYLSPLGTKPQALGFALYYLSECVGTPTSIIFPFAGRYEKETTQGISRVSIFRIEKL